MPYVSLNFTPPPISAWRHSRILRCGIGTTKRTSNCALKKYHEVAYIRQGLKCGLSTSLFHPARCSIHSPQILWSYFTRLSRYKVYPPNFGCRSLVFPTTQQQLQTWQSRSSTQHNPNQHQGKQCEMIYSTPANSQCPATISTHLHLAAR